MSSSKQPAERRRSARKPTQIRGIAKTSQGGRHALEVTDLSVNGCAVVATGHPLRPGAAYGLKINGLETLGSTSTWAAGKTAGLVFEHPLHPAVADHLVLLHPRPRDEPALDEA